ncbi:MAG: heavy-metal-associated domain-containing protein [Nitrospiraceae bacterium]
MLRAWNVALMVMVGLFALSATAWAGEQKVTLKLGGQFCEFYPGEVETALQKVAGVTAVDLKSKKGHVVVTGDASKMKPGDLTAAVDAVKGDGWHCKGDVAK